MPTIVRFRLRLAGDARLRLENAPAQGWLLQLIHRHDPEWAERLHPVATSPTASGNDRAETSRRALYAVSPLLMPSEEALVGEANREERAYADSGPAQHQGVVHLRAGFADDAEAESLLRALPAEPPRLGAAPCHWERVPNVADLHDPDVLVCPWPYLAQAPPAPRLRVLFVTPTAFKRRGALHPLFETERVWAAWRDLWEAGAGAVPPFADELLESGEVPRVSAYRLETQTARLKGGLFIGAVGFVEWTWKATAPDEYRRAGAALAAVSDFLGTGAKAAMGMGQTRVQFLD